MYATFDGHCNRDVRLYPSYRGERCNTGRARGIPVFDTRQRPGTLKPRSAALKRSLAWPAKACHFSLRHHHLFPPCRNKVVIGPEMEVPAGKARFMSIQMLCFPQSLLKPSLEAWAALDGCLFPWATEAWPLTYFGNSWSNQFFSSFTELKTTPSPADKGRMAFKTLFSHVFSTLPRERERKERGRVEVSLASSQTHSRLYLFPRALFLQSASLH